MLSRVALFSSSCRSTVTRSLRRNMGVSAVCCQKVASDPIQKLFVDKIHEYANKSKSAGGKLVDASPDTEKSLKDELEKITRQYGATGADFQKFPTFNFQEVDLQPVGVQVEIKQAVAQAADEQKEKEEDEDKPFYEL